MAARCPNLENLFICSAKLEAWPTLTAPWTSMKKLNLTDVDMDVDLFHSIKLHHSLPNLVFFGLGIATSGISALLDWITLPEMVHCNDLKIVSLNGDDFCINSLPRGIKRLEGSEEIVNYGRDEFEEKYGCEVGGLAFGMDLL